MHSRRSPGVGPVQARRVPDVGCVKYWKREVYAINYRGWRGAYCILIN